MAYDPKRYQQMHDALELERNTWEDEWLDISRYLCPRRGYYISKGQSPDGKTKPVDHSRIIDPTATKAWRDLASGMQGGMTHPSREWFRLGLWDRDLAEFGPVRDWLRNVERSMYGVFARSNFYQVIHDVYGDEGAFGTALLLVEEDDRSVVRFTKPPIGTYSLMADKSGRVMGVYRRFHQTAKNLVQWFGKGRCGQEVVEAAKRNENAWYEVGHCIQRNPQHRPGTVDNQSMEFESVYWLCDKEGRLGAQLLYRGGFVEQAFAAPRWNVDGPAPYGSGPAHDMLADIKTLQEQRKTYLKQAQKAADPPMKVNEKFQGRLRLTPAAQNRYSGDAGDIGPLYDTSKLDVRGALEAMQDTRNLIREGFFNDLFLLLAHETKQMTATEVMERNEERLIMLGPVVTRQHHELLDVIIDRVFGVMFRAGMIPPPPEEVMGTELKVEYISLLAQAQKRLGVDHLRNFIEFAGGVMSLRPEAGDKIDFDQAIDEFGDAEGVPPKVIRSDDDVVQLRQARAQVMQARAELEQAQQVASAAKDVATAQEKGLAPAAPVEGQ